MKLGGRLSKRSVTENIYMMYRTATCRGGTINMWFLTVWQNLTQALLWLAKHDRLFLVNTESNTYYCIIACMHCAYTIIACEVSYVHFTGNAYKALHVKLPAK